MSAAGGTVPSLTVKRSELAEALGMLTRFRKAGYRQKATFGFRDGSLTIELGAISASATATGEWPGAARVAGQFVFGVASDLPETDAVMVRVEGDRLRVGHYVTSCTWETSATNLIRLPANPSLTTLLALRSAYAGEEIVRAGLEQTVRGAEQRRDALIAKAAAVLQPCGVQPDDLRALVDQCLKRMESL